VKGMIVDFALIVWLIAAVFFTLSQVRKGKALPSIRTIPGLDALSECIGRATEMNRPVYYLPGSASYDFSDPQLLASMAILNETAKMAARYECRFIVPCRFAASYVVIQDLVRQAYISEGKAEAYRASDVRWFSDHHFGYTIGVVGSMFREKVAATIMMGNFNYDALTCAEAANQAGAIQVGGTAALAQIPFFIAACDYALIGEELFAAAAYISKDPLQVCTVAVQDWTKLIAIALLLVGMISETFGSAKWLSDLLNK